MKKPHVVSLLVVVLQAFLAASPYYLQSQGVVDLSQPVQFYGLLTTLVGVDVVLITALFSFLFLEESGRFRTEVEHLTERAGSTVVKRLRDDAFYRHFLDAVKDARHTVRIAYFAPTPPDRVVIRERQRYYREVADVMRERPTVRFKRLIRYTDENRQWIAGLIRDLEGLHNVDIAILRGDVPADRRMPLAMSIQTVDDDKTWLVAIASHEREGEYRDIYIENPVVATSMGFYYNRLWSLGEELLEAGKITAAGAELARLPTDEP